MPEFGLVPISKSAEFEVRLNFVRSRSRFSGNRFGLVVTGRSRGRCVGDCAYWLRHTFDGRFAWSRRSGYVRVELVANWQNVQKFSGSVDEKIKSKEDDRSG